MKPPRPSTSRVVAQESHVDFSLTSGLVLVQRMASKWANSSLASVLLAATIVSLLPGCNICLTARRTLFHEPAQFSWKVDRKHSIKAYREWAEDAWLRHSHAASGMQSPCDYEAGFKDGFIDFVNFGGNGEPPPVPPRKYWNLEYRIPAGEPSAADWFAGFRHGVHVAREEGFRAKATIDSSVFYLGPKQSHAYENYYPEKTEGLVPYDTESMELLPPGEFDFEPEQESIETEEVSEEGPMITRPPLETTPTPPATQVPAHQIQAPQVPKEPLPQVPVLQTPAPQASEAQAPKPQPPALQSPIELPTTPLPAEEPTPQVDPPSELEDLFGGRRLESPPFVSSEGSEIRIVTFQSPANTQVKKVPTKEPFVR